MQRRQFLAKSLIGGAILSSGLPWSCVRSDDRLKILVLGGTYFVGPAIVQAALGQGHRVSLFNRGITNPTLFPDLPHIQGDREAGAEALSTAGVENWDVVIDVWPEKSELVDTATRFFQQRAQHYVFISSIAVYNNFQEVGLHEQSQTVDLGRSRDEWGYAEEKLAAENMVRQRFPDKHTILRPGPIKGWRDPALDLFYWCQKLQRDEAIIAPGSGLDPLQFIDVKDVGRFAIQCAGNPTTGTFNITGPTSEAMLWNDFLEAARTQLNSNTQLVWVDEEFLRANEVYSFSDLPLWAPLSEDRGFMQISNQKLNETGFAYTPMEKTLEDCLRWHRENTAEEITFGSEEVDLGLERSRELALIEQWNNLN